MNKKKIFEVTGIDFGKGYYEADDEKEAESRFRRKYKGTGYDVARYKGSPMISNYAEVAPGSARAKQLNVSFKNSTLLSASNKFRKRFM